MADTPSRPDRRKLLTATTGLIGGIGIGAAAGPFIRSMTPSARAKVLGEPVEVDLMDLAPGDLKVVAWRNMPVMILRRTEEMLEDLEANRDRLKDPDSELSSQQPDYARNTDRAIKSEYLVVMGVCTHLGCTPIFRPERAIPEVGDWWRGGFHCPCHKSNYDLAGRVYDGSPAPLNLPIPEHRYLSPGRLVIGEGPASS